MSNNHSRASFSLDFPANLTPAERRAVEAAMRHDTAADAAAELGITRETLRSHTQAARIKAGVCSTVRLVALYLQAQHVGGA